MQDAYVQICITSYLVKTADMPDCLSGIVFVNNNGYLFDGFNPILDVEYVGKPVGKL